MTVTQFLIHLFDIEVQSLNLYSSSPAILYESNPMMSASNHAQVMFTFDSSCVFVDNFTIQAIQNRR